MGVYDGDNDSYERLKRSNRPDEVAASAQAGADRDAARATADQEKAGLYNPDDTSNKKADKPSDAKGDDSEPKGFRKRLKAFNNKRKITIIGSILGIAGLGGVGGFFAVSSGPFQVLHAGNLLQGFHMGQTEDFGDDRSGRQALYALAGKTERGRLGIISNYTTDRWEKRLNNEKGLKSIYNSNGRLVGYEVLDADKAGDILREKPATTRADGRQVIELNGDSFRDRRIITRVITKSLGVNKVSAHLGSRLLIKRAGVDFHPIKNVIRKQNDKFADWREERKKEREARLQTGDPNATATPDGESNGDDSDRGSRRKLITQRLQTFINTAKGPLILLAAICGLKEFSSQIDGQNLDNQLMAIRSGMEKVTVASQVMAGWDEKDEPLNVEQVGIVVDDFYDEEGKTSWSQANSIEAESGETPVGTDSGADIKPSTGDKPWFFDVVDNIPTDPGDLLIGGFFIGQTGVETDLCVLLEDVGEAISETPGIKQLLDAIGAATDWALKQITGYTSEELITMAVAYFASGAVDLTKQGDPRGAIDNMGVFLAAQNQMNAMGGRQQTPEEASEIKSAAREEQAAQFAKASIYDKYFNLYETRSAISRVYMDAPKNREQTIAAIQRLPSTLSRMFATITGVKKAKAQITYDYGVPLYGFSLAERIRPEVENPFANEAYMLEGDRLTRMNAEYGKECFFMEISPTGDLIYGESGDLRTVPDKCKDTNNVELLRYRFYIADLITGHTLACYEGDDTSCAQIGMGAAAVPGTTPPGGNPTGTYVNPLDGSSYRCTSGFGPRWGTQHEGVDMALPVGNRVLAPTSGTVQRAGASTGYGLVVVIQGDDGFYYELGHVDSVSVKVGDKVAAGAEVAKSGNTGQSTGPHLHLSVATGFFTGRIDPETHMAGHGVTLCP